MRKLRNEQTMLIPILKSQIVELEKNKEIPLSFTDKKLIYNQIQALHKRIEELETGQHISNYYNTVCDIIEAYKKYTGEIKTISFTNFVEHEEEENSESLDRLWLIESFLTIAKKYIDINVRRQHKQIKNKCPNCDSLLLNSIIEDNGNKICPNCNAILDILSNKNDKDVNRVTIPTDDSINNFWKTFYRYNGLQPHPPPERLYVDLEKYFTEKCGRLGGEDIKKLPLNSRGRRGDTTHNMLLDALSETGYSEYYDDVNLIGHKYWGWNLPNVLHLKDAIEEKYHKTQRGFYMIPPEVRERDSSLGTQFRLFKHLQLEGHECYMDEFKIAENEDSQHTHNRLWKLMCENADDPSIYYIP